MSPTLTGAPVNTITAEPPVKYPSGEVHNSEGIYSLSYSKLDRGPRVNR